MEKAYLNAPPETTMKIRWFLLKTRMGTKWMFTILNKVELPASSMLAVGIYHWINRHTDKRPKL